MSTVVTTIDTFLDVLKKGATDNLCLHLDGAAIDDAGAAQLAQVHGLTT
jgi:hypothetical protein